MAIAQVQTSTIKNTASSNNDTLAYGTNPTSGSLLVMAYRIGATGQTVAVSDDVNGSWTEAVSRELASHGECGIFYFMNAGAGATTVNITFSSASSIRWSIHEYSGAATTSALDQTNSADGADANAGAPNGPDVTTGVAGELLFSALAVNGAGTNTAGTGWTIRSDVPAAPGTRLSTEDQVNIAGTYSADYASDVTASYIIAVATFKEATAGGGRTTKNTRSSYLGMEVGMGFRMDDEPA